VATTNLISCASFASLNQNQQENVRHFYKNATQRNRKMAIAQEFSTAKTEPFSAINLFHKDTLLKTNPFMIPFMTDASQKALEDDLMLMLYQLSGHYQFNEREGRRQALNNYYNDIEKCDFLIKNIQLAREKKQLLEQPTSNKSDLYHFLFEAELNFFAGQTVYIRKRMADFNYWRLYWVWTGMMLRMAISLISSTFYNIQQTTYVTSEYQDIWGYISWALYFARLLINFSLVLKHTIPCTLWMNKAEIDAVKNQGVLKRFMEQMNARKFELTNDFIWGLVNLGCHLWWIGSALMDYLSNAFTVILLIADLWLTMEKRKGEIKQHDCDINDFNTEIAALNAKIQSLLPEDNTRLKLEEQKNRLEYTLAQYVINWKDKERGLNADKAYAAGVVATFFVLSTCLIPNGVLSTTLSATISMFGAGALFLVAFIYSAYKAYMEVSKARDTELRGLLECKEILIQSPRNLEISRSLESGTETQVKLNFLRYKQLEAESDYHHKLAAYQRWRFARTVLIEFFFPVVLFSAFTFLAFNLAVGVLAIGFVLAVVSHQSIDYFKKPKEVEWVKLEGNGVSSLDNALPMIEKKIREATPYRPLQWLFHSREELGYDCRQRVS
jgi:hypothetical protein